LATHNPIQEKIKHPTAQKKLNFYHRTSGTFGFARHTSPTLRKCKAFTNTIKNYYAVSKTKRAIFCQRTDNDNDDIKLNLADNKNVKY
jgi:hypothetical protein